MRSPACKKNIETRVKGALICLRDEKNYLHSKLTPAVVNDNGEYRAYWVHGRRHRVSGPAIIDGNSGKKFWYFFGKLVAINEKVNETFDHNKYKNIVVVREWEEDTWKYKKAIQREFEF